MKKILVTWWAWFIGSHLCKRLLDEWNEVICMDNLFTGTKENIKDLLSNPLFTFVLHDITQPFWLQVDQIYNLACPASPTHYQKNPVETTRTSILGAINMLELALKVKATILQASTSEVYGDPTIHPQPETYRGNVNIIGPRSCYDEGKRVQKPFLWIIIDNIELMLELLESLTLMVLICILLMGVSWVILSCKH